MMGEMRASYQIWLVSRHGEAPLPARVLQLLFLHPREVGDDGDRCGRHHGTLGFGTDGRTRDADGRRGGHGQDSLTRF